MSSQATATVEPARGSVRVTASCSGSVRVVHQPTGTAGYQPVLVATDLAGLGAGDVHRRDVEVCTGARLVLSDPAPTHLLPGRPAGVSDTVLVVRPGAAAVLLPHAVVPFAGSRARLRSRVYVDPGGFVLAAGIVSPGRVAAGEWWAAASLDHRLDLVSDGALVLCEALGFRSPPRRSPGHLVGAAVCGPDLRVEPARQAAAAFGGTVSALQADLAVLRAIVGSQQAAHALLRAVCEAFVAELRGWDWGRILYGT